MGKDLLFFFCKEDMRIWGTKRGLLHFALRGSRQEKRKMNAAGIMIIPVAYSKINILKLKKNHPEVKAKPCGVDLIGATPKSWHFHEGAPVKTFEPRDGYPRRNGRDVRWD